MENNKEILRELKKIKNVKGALIGTKLDGYKVTINPEIIEGFVRFLGETDSEVLEVEEVAILVLMRELIKVLEIDGHEVVLK